MLIFVYGTLRGGQHPYMGDASFVGDAKAYGYTLIDLGSFPAMITKDGAHSVGEVWNIDPDQIVVLDHFEGSTYFRQRIPVYVGKRKKPLYCYAYVFRYRPSGFDVEMFADWYKYMLV